MSTKKDETLQEKFREQLEDLEKKISELKAKKNPSLSKKKSSGAISLKRIEKIEKDLHELQTKSNTALIRISSTIKSKMDEMAAELSAVHAQTKEIDFKNLLEKLKDLQRGYASATPLAVSMEQRQHLKQLDVAIQNLESKLREISNPKHVGEADVATLKTVSSQDKKRLSRVEKQLEKLQAEITQGSKEITQTLVKKVQALDEKLQEVEAAGSQVNSDKVLTLEKKQEELSSQLASLKKDKKSGVGDLTRVLEEKIRVFEKRLQELRDQSKHRNEVDSQKLESQIAEINASVKKLESEMIQESGIEAHLQKQAQEMQNQMRELELSVGKAEQKTVLEFCRRLDELAQQTDERYKRAWTSVDNLATLMDTKFKEQSKKTARFVGNAQDAVAQEALEGLLGALEAKVIAIQEDILKKIEILGTTVQERTNELYGELHTLEDDAQKFKKDLVEDLQSESGPLALMLGAERDKFISLVKDLDKGLELKFEGVKKNVAAVARESREEIRGVSESLADHVTLMNHQLDRLEEKSRGIEDAVEDSVSRGIERFVGKLNEEYQVKEKELLAHLESIVLRTEDLKTISKQSVEEALKQNESEQEQVKAEVSKLKKEFLQAQEEALETRLEMKRNFSLDPAKFEMQIKEIDQRISKLKKSYLELMRSQHEQMLTKTDLFEQIMEEQKGLLAAQQSKIDAVCKQLKGFEKETGEKNQLLEEAAKSWFKQTEASLKTHDEHIFELGESFVSLLETEKEALTVHLSAFKSEMDGFEESLNQLERDNQTAFNEFKTLEKRLLTNDKHLAEEFSRRFNLFAEQNAKLVAEIESLDERFCFSLEKSFQQTEAKLQFLAESFDGQQKQLKTAYDHADRLRSTAIKKIENALMSSKQDLQGVYQEVVLLKSRDLASLQVRVEELEEKNSGYQSFAQVLEEQSNEMKRAVDHMTQKARTHEVVLKKVFEEELEELESKIQETLEKTSDEQEQKTLLLEKQLAALTEQMTLLEREADSIKVASAEFTRTQIERLDESLGALKMELLSRSENMQEQVGKDHQKLKQLQNAANEQAKMRLLDLEAKLHDMGHEVARNVKLLGDQFLEKVTYEKDQKVLSGKVSALETELNAQSEAVAEDLKERVLKLKAELDQDREDLKDSEERLRFSFLNELRQVQSHVSEVEKAGFQIKESVSKGLKKKYDDFKLLVDGVNFSSSQNLAALEKTYDKRLVKLEARIHSIYVVSRGAAEQVAEDMDYELKVLEKKLDVVKDSAVSVEKRIVQFVHEELEKQSEQIKYAEAESLKLNRRLAEAVENEMKLIEDRILTLEVRSERLHAQMDEKLVERVSGLSRKQAAQHKELERCVSEKITQLELVIREITGAQAKQSEALASFEKEVQKTMADWSADLEIKQHETLIGVTDKILKRIQGFEQKLKSVSEEVASEGQLMHQKLNRKTEDLSALIEEHQAKQEERLAKAAASFENENRWLHTRLQEMQRRSEVVEHALEQRIINYFADFDERLQDSQAKALDNFQGIRSDLTQFGLRFKELIGDLSALDEKTVSSIEALTEGLQKKTERLHRRINELNQHQSDFRRDVIKRVTEFEDQAGEKVALKARRLQKKLFSEFQYKSFLAIVAIASVCIGLLYIYYWSLSQNMKTSVSSEVEERFSSDEVRTTVADVAVRRVPGLVSEQAQPLVKELKQELGRESDAFKEFVNSQKEVLRQTTESAAGELSLLQAQNKISSLESSAINEGDRFAYATLRGLATSKNEDIAFAAEASLGRLKAYYSSRDPIIGHSLSYEGTSGFEYRNGSIPPEALVYYLRNSQSWKTRAKAARLLGTWRVAGVGDVLLQAAESDTHLEVVRNALEGFKQATGFEGDEMFNATEARLWYQTNRKAVNQKYRQK